MTVSDPIGKSDPINREEASTFPIGREELSDWNSPDVAARRSRDWSCQPWSGLIGLGVVFAAAAILGLPMGTQRTLEVLGPVSTFMLPLLAVMALWWGGWPFQRSGRAGAGLLSLAVLVGGALVLTFVGEAVVGKASISHLLGDGAEAGRMVSFPWTVPLAAFVFVTMLQLTFVCRHWPFAKLGVVASGLAALATSWGVGIAGYLLLANWDFVPAPARAAMGLRNPGGPINGLDLIGMLLCVVVWQMVVFFLMEGYPIAKIPSNTAYLAVANVTTIGGGIVTWLVLHDGLNRTVPQIGAFAGVTVAATLIAGLLFEQWPARLLRSNGSRRLGLLATTAVIAVGLGYALRAIALATDTWTRDPALLWVGVTGLNFIGAVVIIHAALWRRWPVAL